MKINAIGDDSRLSLERHLSHYYVSRYRGVKLLSLSKFVVPLDCRIFTDENVASGYGAIGARVIW